MKSKTLGILGLGSYSTLFYIRELNTSYNKTNGGFSTFPFKMLNVNFDKINNLLPYVSDELDAIVKSNIKDLIALGVDRILVPNVTLHETIDRLDIKTEIIHPVYLTLSEIKKKKHQKAILLGSKYTMESDYIQTLFSSDNIEILTPSNEEMDFIDHVRKQVYQQLETDELLDEFNEIVVKYSKEKAVIIACTELSVALSTKNNNVFDMARIQIGYVLR
ncbi:aspartate/glutamate racemase family protein [Brumimicrobium mesophilum]|uniref:aspartate/glutamate racemase family protein n=1 Tax=Brumimicrobium mesophilum TaxID=392717 RepID=UPI00131DA690|nr:aspartate/glutamate racemase family protein [Brumimicrobium mesophilum]